MGDAAEHLPSELPPQARFAPDRMGLAVGVREEIEPSLGEEFKVPPEPPMPSKLVLLKGGITQRGGAIVPKIPHGAKSVPFVEPVPPLPGAVEDVLEEVPAETAGAVPKKSQEEILELQAENKVLGRLVARLYAENEALKKQKP